MCRNLKNKKSLTKHEWTRSCQIHLCAWSITYCMCSCSLEDKTRVLFINVEYTHPFMEKKAYIHKKHYKHTVHNWIANSLYPKPLLIFSTYVLYTGLFTYITYFRKVYICKSNHYNVVLRSSSEFAMGFLSKLLRNGVQFYQGELCRIQSRRINQRIATFLWMQK